MQKSSIFTLLLASVVFLIFAFGLTEVEGAAVSTTTGDTKPDSDCQLLIPKTLVAVFTTVLKKFLSFPFDIIHNIFSIILWVIIHIFPDLGCQKA